MRTTTRGKREDTEAEAAAVASEEASAEEEADSRAVERAAPRLFSITPGAEFRPFSLAGTVEVIGTLCITILVC